MTQATFKTKEGETILAVVVPNGCKPGSDYDGDIKYRHPETGQLIYVPMWDSFKDISDEHDKEFDCEIIGLLSQLTEEQAKEIVKENFSGFYRDYQDPGEWQYGKALLSLQSLIRSLNLNFTPEQDVLLIKVN